MKTIISFVFLFSSIAWAGLPPTTSQLSGDSGPVTTFNYNFPWLGGSHSGVTANYTPNILSDLNVTGPAGLRQIFINGNGQAELNLNDTSGGTNNDFQFQNNGVPAFDFYSGLGGYLALKDDTTTNILLQWDASNNLSGFANSIALGNGIQALTMNTGYPTVKISDSSGNPAALVLDSPRSGGGPDFGFSLDGTVQTEFYMDSGNNINFYDDAFPATLFGGVAAQYWTWAAHTHTVSTIASINGKNSQNSAFNTGLYTDYMPDGTGGALNENGVFNGTVNSAPSFKVDDQGKGYVTALQLQTPYQTRFLSVDSATIADSTVYSFTFTNTNPVYTNTYSITSGIGATPQSIMNQLATAIQSDNSNTGLFGIIVTTNNHMVMTSQIAGADFTLSALNEGMTQYGGQASLGIGAINANGGDIQNTNTVTITPQVLGVTPTTTLIGATAYTSTFTQCVYNGASWQVVSTGLLCTF